MQVRYATRRFVWLIGVNLEGGKEVLGLWVFQSEGAKFWLQVVTEVQQVWIACVDGLKGFPEAIEAVFPQAQLQLGIVHLVRHSLNYVSWKQRNQMAADLKPIYRAASVEEAERQLEAFERKWDASYPKISRIWQRHWQHIIPLSGYPPEIRQVTYTTNAVESLNMRLLKIIKTRGSFPSEAALKLFYLAIENVSRKWTQPVQSWRAALNQFSILFEDQNALAATTH